MNTDARELTDKELYENQELADEFDRRNMKIIETNGGYSKLKDIVFTAVILGAGAFIWAQTTQNSTFEREIAILKLECRNLAQARQP